MQLPNSLDDTRLAPGVARVGDGQPDAVSEYLKVSGFLGKTLTLANTFVIIRLQQVSPRELPLVAVICACCVLCLNCMLWHHTALEAMKLYLVLWYIDECLGSMFSQAHLFSIVTEALGYRILPEYMRTSLCNYSDADASDAM